MCQAVPGIEERLVSDHWGLPAFLKCGTKFPANFSRGRKKPPILRSAAHLFDGIEG
jgi:hypothetical protein